jgi:hypothetical protein
MKKSPRTEQLLSFLNDNKGQFTYREIEQATRIHRRTVHDIIQAEGLTKRIKPNVRSLKGKPMAKKKLPPLEEKSGLEIRGDHIVINWTTKTVITDLGEFGSYVCNFNTHGAIQHAYVNNYRGKGETAARVATRFDFYSNKAVYQYARHHGFTKESIGQTDIEFATGMTAEEAAQDTLQSLKRRALKLIERKKLAAIHKDADKWNNWEQGVLYPMRDWMEEVLPTYKPVVLKLKDVKETFAAIVGVSDWHYMKVAFSEDGKETYNRKIAIAHLKEAQSELVSKMLKQGNPSVIYLPIGTDNLHIDNPQQTTTHGTPQAEQTDGGWATELQNYVDVIINMVEMYSQIAPVEVISIPGNHDKHTSFVIAVMLKLFFEQNERVTVTVSQHPRIYKKYGNTCLVFDHGDDKSLVKFRANMHKLALVEAKEHGINPNQIDEYVFFSGHLHHENNLDLGGVFHYLIPSLAGTDKWERSGLFIGAKEQATLYLIDPKKGRKAVFYS